MQNSDGPMSTLFLMVSLNLYHKLQIKYMEMSVQRNRAADEISLHLNIVTHMFTQTI
jgi:hypothetical protein